MSDTEQFTAGSIMVRLLLNCNTAQFTGGSIMPNMVRLLLNSNTAQFTGGSIMVTLLLNFDTAQCIRLAVIR